MIKRKSFTIVELLCSIAIMLILITLLLVTVQQVRQRAKKTVNINNLKQLSYAMEMYCMDNDGALPYINDEITDSRCLFLLLPYTNYTIKLFYPESIYQIESSSPVSKEYFNNPEVIVDDVKDEGKSFFPGYAYTSIDNDGKPLKDQRMSSDQPVITNINGTYQDTNYILFHNGAVLKINGQRANDSIITE